MAKQLDPSTKQLALVAGIATFSAVAAATITALIIIPQIQGHSTSTKEKPKTKTRSYSINLITGVATRTCIFICSDNNPEEWEKTFNECQVRDQALVSKKEYNQFLNDGADKVKILSQGPEIVNTITSVSFGEFSSYAACHYIPIAVQVESDDECFVPPRIRTPQSCAVSSVPVIVVSDVQSVDYNPDIKPGPLFVLSKLASYAELALSNIHIRPFSHNLGSCFLASNAYLAKKHYNPNHLGIISRKSLKKIQDSGLAKIGEGNIGEEGRQYEVGLFKDYKTPLGIRRVRCSYGIVDNNAGTATYLFHIATPAKNIAAVKRLAGDGHLPL